MNQGHMLMDYQRNLDTIDPKLLKTALTSLIVAYPNLHQCDCCFHWFLVFWDRVFQGCPSCPGTCYVGPAVFSSYIYSFFPHSTLLYFLVLFKADRIDLMLEVIPVWNWDSNSSSIFTELYWLKCLVSRSNCHGVESWARAHLCIITHSNLVHLCILNISGLRTALESYGDILAKNFFCRDKFIFMISRSSFYFRCHFVTLKIWILKGQIYSYFIA